MIADVPLGAFLSGRDRLHRPSSRRWPKHSSRAGQDLLDRLRGRASTTSCPSARLVAERFGTDHHEFVVQARRGRPAAEARPALRRALRRLLGDPDLLPRRADAREHVTVALNGDGGDESFAGYHRYITAARTHAIASTLPLPLRRALGRLGERRAEHGDPRGSLNRALRLARALPLSDDVRYGEAMSFFDVGQRQDLYTPEFSESIGGPGGAQIVESAWSDASGDSLVNVLLEVDANTYLPDDLLVKADIATMAYSLEGRSPLLDHQLMEFAASLPGDLKLRGTEKKVVMRDALRGWIPDRILDGPKRGFALPMAGDWFRGELRGLITEVLTDPGTLGRGYFREDGVRALLEDHLAGTRDHGMQLWGLMMLELWHRELVDKPSPAEAGATA